MSMPTDDWTTPEDVRKRIQREWDNGRILAAMRGAEAVFPLRIPLKRPDSRALAEQFETARLWVAALSAMDKEQAGSGFRLEWQEVAHRQLGRNRIPVAAIVESEKEGLADRKTIRGRPIPRTDRNRRRCLPCACVMDAAVSAESYRAGRKLAKIAGRAGLACAPSGL